MARPVPFEESQDPFEIIGRGIGDPRVAPGRDEVGQGRFELVGVGVGLGAREEQGLDDGALVALEGLFDRVEAVDGDGVELHGLHAGQGGLALGQELLGAIDVLLDAGRELGGGAHGSSRMGRGIECGSEGREIAIKANGMTQLELRP
jgi:hypothetical protein